MLFNVTKNAEEEQAQKKKQSLYYRCVEFEGLWGTYVGMTRQFEIIIVIIIIAAHIY